MEPIIRHIETTYPIDLRFPIHVGQFTRPAYDEEPDGDFYSFLDEIADRDGIED